MMATTLQRPLRTARAAKAWLNKHVHMWKFGNHGRTRFQNDPRYDLENVTRGFAPHLDGACDDTEILKRICAAYNRANRARPSEYPACEQAQSWHQLREERLLPFRRALLQNDASALQPMLRSFYRDPCSAGLMAAPGGLSKAYFGVRIRDIYRRFYLSHVLYRLDYWRELTGRRFATSQLTGPGVGNPFGIHLDDAHIPIGAEYSHYCALRVAGLIDRAITPRATIAEIGGGFGAIAYYLLRDHAPLTYINFDTPERIALSTYYLMKAFPQRTFQLYGERPMSAPSDILLLPTFSLAAFQSASVDITFNSNGFINFAPSGLKEALQKIDAITRHALLYIGNQAGSDRVADASQSFTLVERRALGWHSHKVSGAGVGGAAALASSTQIEQSFIRKSAMRTSAGPSPAHATPQASQVVLR
jgi:hypothetical protein